MKKWEILSKGEARSKKWEVEDIIGVLLENRGIKTKKEIEDFLNPLNPYNLHPATLGIDEKELTKAVERIKQALETGEKIIIYGDYDTDGVCATAILWEALNKLGAKAMPFIPTRAEGYGMKKERLEELKNQGVKLIITVDQGIVANDQVEYAQKEGIDVIITDHHVPGVKRPKACAIIHTTQISGSGVSWFLASQLRKTDLDLVTIGTITDMMSLQGVNRSVAKYGLLELRSTKRLGLLALYQIAGIRKEQIGIYEIGFIIGPRLNAAGRMEDPMESLRLLCTNNEERAAVLAAKINQQNKDRQFLTSQMTLHARQLWLTEDGKSKLIFVSHESYEEGIVGLVAGKLMEEFYRPVIVVSKGEIYSKASARSVNGFNIIEAVRTCADILGPHGGHALAAGFTIETSRIDELKTRLTDLAEKGINNQSLMPVLKVDLELSFSELTFELKEAISNLEPFGFGNPEPVFMTKGVKVGNARLVGSEARHLKLQVLCPSTGICIDSIGFGMSECMSYLAPSQSIDIAYNLICDEWNGSKRLQLRLRDLKINDNE